MEVQDGFVVGIFNYCDRWCERCTLSSRCRVFADHAEMEASLDPNLKAVANAPPLPRDVPPRPPEWMAELIAESDLACGNPPSRGEWEQLRAPSDHNSIDERANEYAVRTFRWLSATESTAPRSGDPRHVISWFHSMIVAKVTRALAKRPDADSEEAEVDSDGSAKVALLGIDESRAAWLELVERGIVSRNAAHPFLEDLLWLGAALERTRPNARAFVRPAFDEPAAIAKLLASEGDP